MRLLGEFYWTHAGAPDALKKAVFWIDRAATVDDLPAQVMASALYREGTVVPQDPDRAASFALQAARSGDADSQYRYATFLDTGFGVERDPEGARDWYRRAAEQGQGNAIAWMADDLVGSTTAFAADQADAKVAR